MYSQDYTEILWDSDQHEGTAEDYIKNSGYDWLPVVVDHAPGHRWSGRCEIIAGDPHFRDEFEYVRNILAWADVPSQVTPPSYEEQRRSLRYQPIGQALAPILRDADLTITTDNSAMHRDGR